jgi:hypothetical protein
MNGAPGTAPDLRNPGRVPDGTGWSTALAQLVAHAREM